MNEPGPAPLPPDPFSHPLVAAADARAERVAVALRGHPAVDRALYALSEVGTHSALWHAVNLADAVAHPGERRRRALRRSAVLVVEEVAVNGAVKPLFGRVRPTHVATHPHGLRTARTSSFPSGHASSGACAAVLLARDLGRGPAWALLAALVAWSRVHVGRHHFSDVAAGAALGALTGLAARSPSPAGTDRQ